MRILPRLMVLAAASALSLQSVAQDMGVSRLERITPLRTQKLRFTRPHLASVIF